MNQSSFNIKLSHHSDNELIYSHSGLSDIENSLENTSFLEGIIKTMLLLIKT